MFLIFSQFIWLLPLLWFPFWNLHWSVHLLLSCVRISSTFLAVWLNYNTWYIHEVRSLGEVYGLTCCYRDLLVSEGVVEPRSWTKVLKRVWIRLWNRISYVELCWCKFRNHRSCTEPSLCLEQEFLCQWLQPYKAMNCIKRFFSERHQFKEKKIDTKSNKIQLLINYERKSINSRSQYPLWGCKNSTENFSFKWSHLHPEG